MKTSSYVNMIIFCTIGLVVLILAICLVTRLIKQQLMREKQCRVQLVEIDKDNAEAERNVRMTQGGQLSLGSSMARAFIDNTYLTFYQLDRKNKVLKLKLPSAQAKQLAIGDVGTVTFRGEDVVNFSRTGNVLLENS